MSCMWTTPTRRAEGR
ncbi:hypothetical protein EYF80_067871 [Liparis tanakae]|uniref:Uncharacterized protein n=1 Tax=Liparis tanakae TaxID=230148 RepID=A0A4Z2DZR6_9TELE|nr:hypothetical protein EYF80_067871 [Liparis tanakae]